MAVSPSTIPASSAPLRWEPLWVALALVLYWLSAWTASKDLPAVADEIAHITGGASYRLYGSNHLQPENGYIAMHWATLPMRWHAPVFPAMPPDLPQGSAMIVIGHRFFYESGNDPAAMLTVGRGLMAGIGAALVGLIWWWSRRLGGPKTGLVAAGLAAFCPTLLAHGGLVMSDITLSFFLLLTLTLYWSLLRRVTPVRLLAVGLCAGALLLSKMSGVLALPMMAVLALIRATDGRALICGYGRTAPLVGGARKLAVILASAVIVAVLAGGVLWAAFGFEYSMFTNPTAPRPIGAVTWATLLSGGATARIVSVLRDGHLLPEAWLHGFAQTVHTLPGRLAFLNGETSDQGWFWYFPYACLVKTPLPLFGLMALGVVAFFRQAQDTLHRASPLIVLFGVYWFFALTTGINIGHRHLLPVYAPMLILAAAAAHFLTAGPRPARALIIILLLWFAAESLWARPRYLSYFNSLAGGPAGGYRHLVDSNIDVGQDLIELRRWLETHDGAESKPESPIFLSYFGPADPVRHGIHAVRFGDNGFDARPRSFPVSVKGGRFCVSVTLFQGMYTLTPGPWTPERDALYRRLLDNNSKHTQTAGEAITLEHLQFARLRSYLATARPEARIGHSILVFKLNDHEVGTALYAPWADVRQLISARDLPSDNPL